MSRLSEGTMLQASGGGLCGEELRTKAVTKDPDFVFVGIRGNNKRTLFSFPLDSLNSSFGYLLVSGRAPTYLFMPMSYTSTHTLLLPA